MVEERIRTPVSGGHILPTDKRSSMVGSILLFSTILLFSASCDQRVELFSEATELGGEWSQSREVAFEMAIPDTSTLYDLQLLIDNTEEYPYRNMYVFVDMGFPNEKWLRDTVEFYLTDPSGRWLGESSGGGYHNQVLYKYKRKLPLPGDYVVRIRHGMRTDELQGIEKVGLRIVESQ